MEGGSDFNSSGEEYKVSSEGSDMDWVPSS